MRDGRVSAVQYPAQPGSAATFIFRTLSFMARPDSADACQSAIDELADYVNRCERSTRFIGSFRDAEETDRFLLALVFEDERALRRHEVSAARLRFDALVRGSALSPVRSQSWEPGTGL